MKKWHYGYFAIPDEIYNSVAYSRFVWKLFQYFRPVAIEYDWHREEHLFYGYSELFDKSTPENHAPKYEVMILNEDNKITISFKKL